VKYIGSALGINEHEYLLPEKLAKCGRQREQPPRPHACGALSHDIYPFVCVSYIENAISHGTLSINFLFSSVKPIRRLVSSYREIPPSSAMADSKAMIPVLVTMMLITGVCNTLLTKYQVGGQEPHLDHGCEKLLILDD
jgi:hypothetical protein